MDQKATALNRLAAETSPYLLQHAENPVNWWPWCDAAFEEATTLGRPVLLSIGYSACHWCHVMAHESFENPEIARQMNRHFVNIKVDREEHPEVDAIYQEALSLLGEQGGWPLTLFLTPSREPFWGGTYFPSTPRFGRPGFSAILTGIADAFTGQAQQIDAQRAALANHMRKNHNADRSGTLSPAALDESGVRFLGLFDPLSGGLKGAPKFPQPAILGLMWACWHRTGDGAYLQAHNHTLEKISQGGIYDHLGGGFARYSVDDKWLAPHFEKMLYDNALLIEALVRAWQSTGNPLFRVRVEETVAWLLREMVVGGGGFTAALDADSEGVEGKFYVWSQAEIDAALGADAALFSGFYGVTPDGNWAEGGKGVSILNRLHETRPPTAKEETRLAVCRQTLLSIRAERIRPGRDDKVLADWNGLAIAALAIAGRVFDRPDWCSAAERAFAFVCDEMAMTDMAGGGASAHISHSWCGRATPRAALLDDYANMIRAATLLAETSSKSRAAHFLGKAEAWAGVLIDDFLDPDPSENGGGLYISPRQASDLIVRARHAHDGPVPSGNAVAAEALTRLATLTGNVAYRNLAAELVTAFAGEIHGNLFPHAGLLTAFAFLEDGLEIVVIGPADDPAAKAALESIYALPLPAHVLTVTAADGDLPDTHPAHDKTGAPGTFYICRAGTCSLPISPVIPPVAGDPMNFESRLCEALNIPRTATAKPPL